MFGDAPPVIEGQPSLPSAPQRCLTSGLYLVRCGRNTLIGIKLPKEVNVVTLMPTLPVKRNSSQEDEH
jgi:hypothetical protein